MLCLASWLALRRLVGARLIDGARPGAMLLELMPIAIGFALFLLATARPVLSGVGMAGLAFGLGLTDVMKRRILAEPVVFADRAELLDVVRHPRFYIAFIGTIPMVIGTVSLLGLIGLELWVEPPLWHIVPSLSARLVVAAIALGRFAFVLPAQPWAVGRLARLYAHMAPSRDPATDARRFGLLASLVIQATLARAERPARRAAACAVALPPMPARQGPIILWQAESFADPTRLAADYRDRLPTIAAMQREATAWGPLSVPAWGANTIRTELAAIAGLGPEALGLDRFNPYDAFVRVPLPSLAAQARAAGYRTICVHPYSRSFYARDTVIPLLGFDRFIGIEAFAAAETDTGYVTDMALARFVADLVRAEGPDLFVFAISIENHGPWDAKHDGLPAAPLPAAWRGLPDSAAIGRWLRHIEAADRAMAILRESLIAQGRGWIGFYGDHQPSLQGPFAPGDRRTDYFMWRPGGRGAVGPTEMRAETLPRRWLELMGSGLE
jgi:hypothetical protein